MVFSMYVKSAFAGNLLNILCLNFLILPDLWPVAKRRDGPLDGMRRVGRKILRGAEEEK